MEWSERYTLTMDALAQHEAKNSGIYRIALRDAAIEYPGGPSPVVFIGAAPLRRLTERLKDHIRGWGNQCIYWHIKHGDSLIWQNLITEDICYTSLQTLADFKATYGALPRCNENANTFNKTGGT